ncbi:MAG: thiamine ABC transporter substrate-binding protein [Treponema sp.]|nr:thiamine ABC transporter substrate-binding protein [Treponema sp.]
MKKFSSLIVFSILVCALFMGCKKSKVDAERASEVIVYTYDSFCSEWGPGPIIAQKFQEKTGIKVTYADCGDGVQILSKAILEKKDPYADVLVGLDNFIYQKAEEAEVLEKFKPSNSDVIKAELVESLGGNWILTPYDYSPFAIIYNTQSDIEAPTCLEDLTKSEYSKKLILMDPRTSTPGNGFDVWVRTVYGEKYDDYMKRLTPSILTMAPGWSVGYGMFTDGEAPLVISYVTSPAYHIEYDEGDQFVALEFTDGHVMQVEGAGLVKGAKNAAGAKKFIEFLASEEAQHEIPLTQWMYPANKNVVLPASYSGLIQPKILN